MRPPSTWGSHLAPHTHIHCTLGGEAGVSLRPIPQEGLSCCRPQSRRYLAWCTLGPIQWGALLGLAEVWVVGVAAPQLLAGLRSRELRDKGSGVTGLDWLSSSDKVSRGQRAVTGRAPHTVREAEGAHPAESHTPSSLTLPQVPLSLPLQK